jgi:hypothetical protein
MDDPLSNFLASDLVKGLRPSEAMTEAEWVEHAIALLNEPLITAGLIRRLCASGGPELNAKGKPAIDGDIVGAIPESTRTRLIEWLDRIIEDRASAQEQLASEACSAIRDVVCIPFPFEEEALKGRHKLRRIGVRYRILSPTVSAALRYTLPLLLDEQLGLGKRLARCRLCKRFFLRTTERRRYCSDAHMVAANAATGSERVLASRKGIPVAEWRRRRK